jgi:hypothetical protein
MSQAVQCALCKHNFQQRVERLLGRAAWLATLTHTCLHHAKFGAATFDTPAGLAYHTPFCNGMQTAGAGSVCPVMHAVQRYAELTRNEQLRN